uniref:Uncharacterized protein n=1 Tax=Oryza glumipatula TaxID=40148 RepID=A0A0E0AUT9_9ORYZ
MPPTLLPAASPAVHASALFSKQIPSSFSIRLVDDPHSVEDLGSMNRRLLNTEKIIFKAQNSWPVYVLVTVEPEG